MNQSATISPHRIPTVSIAAFVLMIAISAGCQVPSGTGSFAALESAGIEQLASADLQRENEELTLQMADDVRNDEINRASAAVYGLDNLNAVAAQTSAPVRSSEIQSPENRRLAQNSSPRSSGAPVRTPYSNGPPFSETQLASGARMPSGTQSPSSPSNNGYFSPENQAGSSDLTYRAQSPVQEGYSQSGNGVVQDSNVQPAAYQYPELQQQAGEPAPIFSPGSINVGAQDEVQPLVYPNAPGGVATFPNNYADLNVYVSETQTGRFNFGGAYN
ncbi:MAG: hypothetical protein AAF456_22830, partial [Planctomycetota bacterium]